MSTTMKAVLSDGTGALTLSSEAERPVVSGHSLLVEVFASGLNRIDTYMMKGAFGRVPILGMEIAGRVVERGPDCLSDLQVGDAVIALLSDSGHAEFAVVDERHAMRKPDGLSYAHAAAIPEQWLTAFQLLHLVGEVQEGDRVLIHAGASGVGTTAIQLCRLAGAVPYITAGSDEKISRCVALGAEAGFNYKDDSRNWAEDVMEATGGKGINVVLDCVGGSHSKNNLQVLATDARWVLFGLMGGRSIEGENLLGDLMSKRASLRTTTLRMRSHDYKAQLVARFTAEVLSKIGLPGSDQPLQLVVDSVFSLEKIEDAYARLVGNHNVGKIVVTIKDTTAKVQAVADEEPAICGGVRPSEHAATADVQALCDSLKDAMLTLARKRGWNGTFKKFEAIAFKTQVVAGTNYFVKIAVTDNLFIHARIYKSLTGEAGCTAVRVVKDETELGYFE